MRDLGFSLIQSPKTPKTMKIAIVGAGIVGVTTAYELAADGHAVTVFEQRNAAAEESSFATGGLLGPAGLDPWAAPGAWGHARWWGAQATLRLGRSVSLAELSWLRRWRRAARLQRRSSTPPAAWLALLQWARYSQARLQDLALQLDLPFEQAPGALVLMGSAQDVQASSPMVKALREAGHTVHEVDADTVRCIEPGLSPTLPLQGALHLPDGMAGNCRQFALLLRQAAQRLGAQFEFGSAIAQISTQPPGVRVQGEAEPRRFDAVVLCAGAQAATLLHPLGLRLPLVALHGCTISAPLREALHAPQGVVMDMASQASIARIGQRVRIAGGAELGCGPQGVATTQHQLWQALNKCFPGAISHSSGVQIWRGARPMLPDGPPAVGASAAPGLWLNLGHGASGWALACASARALADQMTARTPDVPMQAVDPGRFLG